MTPALTNRYYQKVTMSPTVLKTDATFDGRVIPIDATETMWNAPDGWPIRRIDWVRSTDQKPRGSLLFLPGRGDHYEKYLETLAYYAAAGWQVTAIDWRGQGGSGRVLDDPHVGHIDDFATWIADIRSFWTEWKRGTSGPHVVLAHSMGGHLAMRALVEQAIDPDAALFSAPMLSIQTGGLPLWINQAFAKLMEAIGRGEKAAWKESEKPLSRVSLRAGILTHDPVRYEDEIFWWKKRPIVKLGPPSWHWVERAVDSIRFTRAEGVLEAVTVPVLLMATTADQLVSTKAIIADSKRLPNAELLLFGKEAAHELLREVDPVRNRCLAAMDAFLAKHAPAV
jgi:lysophospholipase